MLTDILTRATTSTDLKALADSLPDLSNILLSANFQANGQIDLALKDEASGAAAAEILHLAAEPGEPGSVLGWLWWSGTYADHRVWASGFPSATK